MGSTDQQQRPILQRLYDRVWLLAALALVFWAFTYIIWGLVDIMSVPPG